MTLLKHNRWQFWIDRGGTFTDIVARRPDGTLLTHKLLSENPKQYQDAVLQGIRNILGLKAQEIVPAALVESIKLGTTVGTNALLEHKGEPTALAITQGFGDALEIGYQNRPEIFARQIRKPEPLYQAVIEVPERIDATGNTVTPLDMEQAQKRLQAVFDEGIRALAIVLIHGYRYPRHEQALAALAESIGFTQISVSHQISPLIKLVARGDTTVVDAYLSPCLRRYSQQLMAGTDGNIPIWFMQSHGGLTRAECFHGKDSILSGPAGGMVAAVAVCRQAGLDHIVTFDMGGTSTDVAHYAGELERSLETEIAGVRLQTPMLKIHTVAAGGGSLLKFKGGRYLVGPDSAGADPGPLSYRKGGPLAVTDANVMLGKIQPAFFPKVFGQSADQSLDLEGVQRAFSRLAEEIHTTTGDQRTPEAVAEGFLAVAVENMADAIKKISIQQGHDLTHYTLCCYGAAAGQHACLVAERLGIRRIFLHPFAGVLSAYGMGLADFRQVLERSLQLLFSDTSESQLKSIFATLETQGRNHLIDQGIASEKITCQRRLHLRYQGTDTTLEVPFASKPQMRRAFEAKHKQQFGFINPDKPLIIDTLSLEAIGKSEEAAEAPSPEAQTPPTPAQTVKFYSRGRWQSALLFLRENLTSGHRINGPALIIEPTSTTVIEPGWQGVINPLNQLILEQLPSDPPMAKRFGERPFRNVGGLDGRHQASKDGYTAFPKRPLTEPVVSESDATITRPGPDPVRLEIFNKQFMAVAEQMGYTLQNTAFSVNIKERLDYSCALFDSHGNLVANAPHIPVHLGSMGESVKALLEKVQFKPGEVWLTNSPYHGGTHLPDITVVTPVFNKDGNQILFLLASRGHHADIGGKTPGSMPPDSRHIDEEGVWSAGLKIVSRGQFLETEIHQWLTNHRWPARNPEQNLADLRAQIAANEKGLRELQTMISHWGLETVQAYMKYIQDNAKQAVQGAISKLRSGHFRYRLDNDAEIAVTIKVDATHGKARIDFSGTSAQQPDNFNAPAAVCKAAVLYVFRTLVEDDIPLNAGCLEPLEILLPEASLLNPAYPAAVVAGNVETSQTIVDAIYGALGVLAASQGTMNNLTFGDKDHQYYETICGGAGAGPGFDGADAVHTHMTNSRITDLEVLEMRFPVRVEAFCIRRGSGGAGKYHGGDGVIRKIRFLQPMTAAILSNRRRYPPFGLAGGQPGALGKNTLIRANGESVELGSCAQIQVHAGDLFVIETPGGGGYGKTTSSKHVKD